MERKTKTLTGVVSVALFLALIGYYFSLLKGNANNLSYYTNLILICTFCTGILFRKEKSGNKFFDALVKIDCVLFVIWVITNVVELFL